MLDEYKKTLENRIRRSYDSLSFGTKGIFEYVRGLGKIFDCFLFE